MLMKSTCEREIFKLFWVTKCKGFNSLKLPENNEKNLINWLLCGKKIMHFHQTVDCKLGSTIILKSQCNQWGRGLGSMGSWPSVLVKLLFSNNTLLLGCLCGPVINSVFGRLCTKTASRGREDTRVWYRETMFSQMVLYDFPLHRPLHEYFSYLVSAPARNPEDVVNL